MVFITTKTQLEASSNQTQSSLWSDMLNTRKYFFTLTSANSSSNSSLCLSKRLLLSLRSSLPSTYKSCIYFPLTICNITNSKQNNDKVFFCAYSSFRHLFLHIFNCQITFFSFLKNYKTKIVQLYCNQHRTSASCTVFSKEIENDMFYCNCGQNYLKTRGKVPRIMSVNISAVTIS